VPFFSQRAEPLQQLKTAIFQPPRQGKDSPPDKPQERKNRGSLPLTGFWKDVHSAAFEDLKGAFTGTADILRHFDASRVLYVFLDASKDLGFGVAAYQLEGVEADDALKPSRTSLRPIIFLSKCLSPAERNYWPTDLELAGLVWAVKHLRIYIEQTRAVIYTDHRANPTILAARSLRTMSPLKMNTRQQGWAVFLSQYWDNMTVVYKEGRDMIVPDALSRLSVKLRSAAMD
jgi:RNase H-like domain found in reverse transcriptase